jgi:hypothetical protein
MSKIAVVFDPRDSLIESARADHFEPRGSENVLDHVATYIIVLEDKDPGTSLAAGPGKSNACHCSLPEAPTYHVS